MAVSVRQFIGGILGGGSSSETYPTIAQLPLAGNVQGSLAFVSATNRLYIWNGTGWFNIALINTNPTITQGPNPTYVFGTNGTPIVITLIANDPEGLPIVWSSQVTSGTLGNTAVITQNNNVFTITPSTNEADVGLFGVTFTASDGVNIATAASTFTLVFSAADTRYNQSILLTTSSVNNANNNVFVDSSTNNFTVTRNGNTTQGTFSPYSPAGWSAFFDGTGDFLSAPNNSALDLGSGDFTIEGWWYFTDTSNQAMVSKYTANNGFVVQYQANSLRMVLGLGSSDVVYSFAWTAIPNIWNHVAITRSGTSGRAFINGVQIGSTTTVTTLNTVGATTLQIGSTHTVSELTRGYVSNFRLVKGTALYTANFTPATQPLTAVSGTSLLTLQDNRFIDRSTNNFAITRNGDTRITPFSPFLPTLPYDPATHGGSAYFDGTGDNIQIPYSATLAAGTTAYSFEVWVYFTGNNANQGVIGTTSDGFAGFERSSNNWAYYQGTAGTATGVAVVLFQWNHVVICRNSSGNGGFFVNGTRLASFTDTANKANFGNLQIGYNGVAGGAFTTGYISDYRYVKGATPYDPTQTTLTVPTAPLTAVANTSLLLNSTNAAIFDETGKIVLETVGDAKTSTAVVKYGTTSMAFDGSGDALIIPYSSIHDLGTSNLTWEMWINTTNSTQYATMYSRTPASFSTGMWALMMNFASSTAGDVAVFVNEYSPLTPLLQTTGVSVRDGAWHHIAVVRNGSSWVLYVDGVSRAAQTWAGSVVRILNSTYVGADQFYGRNFAGHISDLRITKGHARYTANFTPPTARLGYTNPE